MRVSLIIITIAKITIISVRYRFILLKYITITRYELCATREYFFLYVFPRCSDGSWRLVVTCDFSFFNFNRSFLKRHEVIKFESNQEPTDDLISPVMLLVSHLFVTSVVFQTCLIVIGLHLTVMRITIEFDKWSFFFFKPPTRVVFVMTDY